MQYVVLSASSHRHLPLPLALAGDVRNLATSSLDFRRSFADLSRNLLQNSPANVIDLRHSQHRQGINNASVGAAYLPLQGSGVYKYVSAQACLQKSNAESLAKKRSFFRELHRRSFAEGFKPRRMVTEYITPCKDLLINPHIDMPTSVKLHRVPRHNLENEE